MSAYRRGKEALDSLRTIPLFAEVDDEDPLRAAERFEGVGRVRERRFELANAFEALRVGNEEVVRVERESEETPLVRVAHHEKLFRSVPSRDE